MMLDLPVGEPEFPVELAGLRIRRFGVGQVELGRTGFEDDVPIRRVGDLAKALRRQHDSRVLLAQGAQPFLELRAEGGIGQHHPRLVDDDEGGPAVEPLLDAVKEIGEDRDGDLRSHADQGFELEGDQVTFKQHIVIGVEKAAERARERVRSQPVAHGGILHLGNEVGNGALPDRRLAQEFSAR